MPPLTKMFRGYTGRKEKEELLKTIKEELANAFKRGDEAGSEFMLDEDIYAVWNPTRLQILSKGLDWADIESQNRALAEFRKVMSILVYIHWDEWEHFKKTFLNHTDRSGRPDRTDEDLPFPPSDSGFLGSTPRREFLKTQYIFIPVVLVEESKYDTTDSEYHKLHRMPFLRSEFVGEGATGVVRKELVAARHFRRGDSLNESPMWVASKYIERGASTGPNSRSFSTEKKALRSFKQCLEQHGNIMHSYTTFTHGPYFLIISPLADLDLRKFFEGDYADFGERQRRFTPLDLLREASCLAGALNFLHHRLRLRNKKIACAHLDFKPDNVLVKWSVDNQRMPVGQWLVHDFGTARIKEPSEETTALAPGDFLAHFSLTKAQRTPGPFQAPEVQPSEEKVVGRESDMWSFGCLLAVVEAFAIGGPRYVNDLGKSRYTKYQPNQAATDYFYTINRGKAVVKPTIIGFLDSLKKETTDSAWIGRTLDLVFKLLVDVPTKRLTAQEAQDQLDIITSEEERYMRHKCGWVNSEQSNSQPSGSLPIQEHGGLQHVEPPPRFIEPPNARWSTITTDAAGMYTASNPADRGFHPHNPRYSPPQANINTNPPSQTGPVPLPVQPPTSPYANPSRGQVPNTSRFLSGTGAPPLQGLSLMSNNTGQSVSSRRHNSGSSNSTHGSTVAYYAAQTSDLPRQYTNAPNTPTRLQAPPALRGGNGQVQSPYGQPQTLPRNSSSTSRTPSIVRTDTQGFQVLSPGTSYPTSPDQNTPTWSDESSSFGSGSALSLDVSFIHLIAPPKASKTVLCPTSKRVASISNSLALVPNFILQNNWAPKRPAKSPDRNPEGFGAPQNIRCPPNYEWDLMSLCNNYLVLRAQNSFQSKFFRYNCHSIFVDGHNLEIWNEDPFSTSLSGVPASDAINGMANHVVDVSVNWCGDTLFVLDHGLCYYSSAHGFHTLETVGQLRKACFSTDGQYIFAWSVVGSPSDRQDNRWYIWQASNSAQIMNQPRRRIPPPRPGSGRDCLIFPLNRYFGAFERPNRLYIIGSDLKQSQIALLNSPVEDIVAGAGYENSENQSQGLILVQGGASPRLINIPLLANVAASVPSTPQKLKEGYNPDTHAIAVVVEEQVTFVAVAHPSGLIERRKITT